MGKNPTLTEHNIGRLFEDFHLLAQNKKKKKKHRFAHFLNTNRQNERQTNTAFYYNLIMIIASPYLHVAHRGLFSQDYVHRKIRKNKLK